MTFGVFVFPDHDRRFCHTPEVGSLALLVGVDWLVLLIFRSFGVDGSVLVDGSVDGSRAMGFASLF